MTKCKICDRETRESWKYCSVDCRKKDSSFRWKINNPAFNNPEHSMRVILRNKSNKGKTWEQIQGEKSAKERRTKKSESWKGENNPNSGGLKESTKKKLSEWRTGKTYEEIYGIKGARIMREKRREQLRINNINKNTNPEVREKNRQLRIGKSYEEIMGFEKAQEVKKEKSKLMKLDGNHQWRGGKSFEPYPIEFNDDLKKIVKENYNYLCQRCGISEKKSLRKLHWSLCVHHVDCDKNNNSEGNLIPLCVRCHRQVHIENEILVPIMKSI